MAEDGRRWATGRSSSTTASTSSTSPMPPAPSAGRSGRHPRPRIGYFGGIDDYRVDFDLLERVARAFPEAAARAGRRRHLLHRAVRRARQRPLARRAALRGDPRLRLGVRRRAHALPAQRVDPQQQPHQVAGVPGPRPPGGGHRGARDAPVRRVGPDRRRPRRVRRRGRRCLRGEAPSDPRGRRAAVADVVVGRPGRASSSPSPSRCGR